MYLTNAPTHFCNIDAKEKVWTKKKWQSLFAEGIEKMLKNPKNVVLMLYVAFGVKFAIEFDA